jgi:hypothetical protein
MAFLENEHLCGASNTAPKNWVREIRFHETTIVFELLLDRGHRLACNKIRCCWQQSAKPKMLPKDEGALGGSDSAALMQPSTACPTVGRTRDDRHCARPHLAGAVRRYRLCANCCD